MKNLSILIVSLFIFFTGCKAQEQQYYTDQGKIFGTSYSIKYKYKKPLTEEIKKCLKEYDMSLNPFNKQSIIYKVNNNIDVEVDSWFKEVFNKAMEVSDLSNGSYDITAAPYFNLWGFGYEKMDDISQHAIDSLKKFVGYKKIRLEGNKVVKDDPRVQLNMSSIAKGHSSDVVAALLESFGVENYMVEIGGEIHAKGKNDRGICWRIQLNKPVDPATDGYNNRMGVLELCDCSVATSGDYLNYRIKDGKKYGHTIDASTGYPAESNILSASVLYSDCMTADAMATLFLTKDLATAVAIAKSIPDLRYIFIYADEKTGELKTISNY